MATKPYSKKKIQETNNSGFGKYDEGVGGGASPSPLKPGTHGHGVNSDHRKEHNDTMQPRTDDGKFTYKSVNGQSIDPKYGPSRGETVNPLLTGGKNGVKIDDVQDDFAQQSGNYWNKYKDSWYTKGGEMVLQSGKKWQTRVAGATIWEIAKRRYDKVKGEFEGESSTFEETKKGAPGIEEKAAKQMAKTTGQEQAVISQKTGGIKLKPGAKPVSMPAPKPQPTVGQPVAPSPVIPTVPGEGDTAGVQPTATTSGNGLAQTQSKYTDDQLAQAKQLFADNDIDVSGLTPRELDDYIDKYIDFDTQEDADTDNNADADNNTQNNSNDDLENKIKNKMGITDED